MTITCIWDGHNMLGESPIWDHQHQQLYWIDIDLAEIYSLDLQTMRHKCWHLPSKPGCVGLASEDRLVIALEKGFALMDRHSGGLTDLIQPLLSRTDVMFNDGACDRQGNFWAGTKDISEISYTGVLYRLAPDGGIKTMDRGFIVSNGIAWSPDNKTCYLSDSGAGKIYRYEYNSSNSTLGYRQMLVNVPSVDGYPDGLTVDSEGYLWSAHWDGWRITRYDPDGEIDRVIKMPVQRPTSLCFGGKDLKTLFVTSAQRDLSAKQLKVHPKAGCVFAIDLDVAGISEPTFMYNA